MDKRLRELERRASQGDLQDRINLLIERVRQGIITDFQVRIAARLGDIAAQTATGELAFFQDGTQATSALIGQNAGYNYLDFIRNFVIWIQREAHPGMHDWPQPAPSRPTTLNEANYTARTVMYAFYDLTLEFSRQCGNVDESYAASLFPPIAQQSAFQAEHVWNFLILSVDHCYEQEYGPLPAIVDRNSDCYIIAENLITHLQNELVPILLGDQRRTFNWYRRCTVCEDWQSHPRAVFSTIGIPQEVAPIGSIKIEGYWVEFCYAEIEVLGGWEAIMRGSDAEKRLLSRARHIVGGHYRIPGLRA